MRLAICTDTFIPQVNGVAKTIARLANFLCAAGVEILVLAPECGLDSQSVPYTLHTVDGIIFPPYPGLKIPIPGYGEITRVLDNFKPDIIHLVTPFTIGLLSLKYAKNHQIPLVSSYHTNFPQYLHYYKFNLFESLAWHFICWFHCHSLVNYCPSQATLDLLRSKGINNLEIWDRGIDCMAFNPVYKNKELRSKLACGKDILILYVGRLAKEKDLDILMKAMQTVNRQLNNIQLILTGDGPLADELKKTAPYNTTFTGYKHGKELSEIYASCDIFAFPSTTETFGNVVLEAMASGLPVVGALAGGVKDNLVNEHNGIGCRPRSSKDMANTIIKMVKNTDYRKLLSHSAREYALTKSWDEVFNRLLKSYKRVLDDYDSLSKDYH